MSRENTGVIDQGHEKVNSYQASHSTAESGSQIDMQTLEKNIFDKMTSEVENVLPQSIVGKMKQLCLQ